MRRQTSQPVLTIDPELDTTANPPRLDTMDPDIGIVREFKVSGNTWARYEVWKAWGADPDPDRLAWRQQYQCLDVSEPRADSAPGTMWRLRSIGYIYSREDSNVAYNMAPNHILASELAEAEVRRVVIQLPGQAALNVDTGSTCVVNSNGRVAGGAGAGIYYPQGTGTPAGSGQTTGSPARSAGTTYDGSFEGVFGMSAAELQTVANLVVSTADDFPSPLPTGAMVIVDGLGSLTLDSSNPLLGVGMVIVRGNLTLSPGNNSNFSGLLYVDGDLTIRSPCEINGAVVCTGSVLVQGASDFATINFDNGILEQLMQDFGNYRLASTTLLPRQSR
jgi:hypothetical protein